MSKNDTKLRDHLLDALKPLPGLRRFRLHVLIAAPRRYPELYPYASTRPRVYAQHVFVLCSEQQGDVGSEQAAESQRIFVSAIEATLFHIPTSTSAILYIAKVDSTGQGLHPSPTSALVRAFISYYVHPTTRPPKLRGTTLWVHLFARAERQYLFPNSADHPKKKPLSDVKLCAWWKRILGRVVQDTGIEAAKLFYVLPGMNELEAIQALGESLTNSANSIKWIYGHPYSQKEIPLPYVSPTKSNEQYNLGQLIPSFDDDPKTRFMDEIACTTQIDGVRSPRRKRRKTTMDADDKDEEYKRERSKEKEKEKDTRPAGELGTVSADEFWERMSFRQECVAGAITGFFVLVFPFDVDLGASSTSKSEQTTMKALAPQPGEVSHHLVKRVIHSLMTGHEFSTTERSLWATSVLEASIKSLCSGPLVNEIQTQREKPPFLVGDEDDQEPGKDGQETLSTPRYLEPPRTPPRRALSLQGSSDGISPNPFPEPEPSADTYSSFVYGEVAISNPNALLVSSTTLSSGSQNGNTGNSSGASGVTVLTVRKKKRKDT